MFPIFFAALNAEDRQTVEALYVEYEKSLYVCAYKITGDRQYAEDAVNDAFLALTNNLGMLSQSRNTLESFLFAACKSAAWKYRSKFNAPKEILVPNPDLPPPEDEDEEEQLFHGEYTDEELASVVATEYTKLSDKDKELLRLRLVCQLNYQKISELTGRTVSSLKTSYSRLIKKLKRRIKV